ncbi:MAG TPA: cytochrome B6, partial [Myxococcota bacterium]|nr:cytochrome B6 [Myxococcota bacterium]
MRRSTQVCIALAFACSAIALGAQAQPAVPQREPAQRPTSYMPVDITEPFDAILSRMRAAKPEIQKRQADLLAARYDLANRALPGAKMTKGKPVQGGVRAKLSQGMTWEQLAQMSPADI